MYDIGIYNSFIGGNVGISCGDHFVVNMEVSRFDNVAYSHYVILFKLCCDYL